VGGHAFERLGYSDEQFFDLFYLNFRVPSGSNFAIGNLADWNGTVVRYR
jgi:hypothetical protein